MKTIDKLQLKTEDITNENVKILGELFPDILTEVDSDGKLIKTINVDKLKELVGDFADKDSEIYELTWAGKQKARRVTTQPTTQTLRPVIEDSVDFENTENLYIEGDNLEVLKILRKSYSNSIKMIYIDPPYNTGKDFVYNDNFAMSIGDYEREAGAFDEEGNRLIKNTGTDGRFHSNWLNMMYPRLQLAYKLLKKDGVIFISINDNEVANLIKICNEIFGEMNVDLMIWRKSGDGRDGKMKNTETFRKDHEYLVTCFKNINKLNKILEKPNFKGEYLNPDNDPRGNWLSGSISRSDDASNPSSDNYYTVKSLSGKEITRQFEISKDKFNRLNSDNRISWGNNGDSIPRIKTFINEERSITPYSILLTKGTTTEGKEELRDIFQITNKKDIFSNPKPSELMRTLTQIGTDKDSIVLDFFAGSCSLAHGVLLQNIKDSGKRTFIQVQLDENLDENFESADISSKEVIKNSIEFLDSINMPHLLTEIGKERIRRAAKKIKEDNIDKDLSNVDFGFRVFKLDSSNLKDTYYNPGAIEQMTLSNFKDSIKEDRTEEDILYQVLLDMAIPISAKVELKTIKNKKVFVVSGGWLVACFDDNIDLELVKELAEIKSDIDGHKTKFVFREASFKDDSAMINAMEYLKIKVFKTDSELKSNVKVV